MGPDARPITDADFPGYREAVAREHLIRVTACLNLTERICGLDVLALTPYHLRFLSLVKSPFLFDGLTAAELIETPGIVDDVMTFLWIVSPLFRPGSGWRARWNRRRFNKEAGKLMRVPAETICKEILDYMENAYIDHEREASGESKSYFCQELIFAFELHKGHGYRIDFWNDAPGIIGHLLGMSRRTNPSHVPLNLIFQLRKARKAANDAEAVLTNKSEALISQGLSAMNARN